MERKQALTTEAIIGIGVLLGKSKIRLISNGWKACYYWPNGITQRVVVHLAALAEKWRTSKEYRKESSGHFSFLAFPSSAKVSFDGTKPPVRGSACKISEEEDGGKTVGVCYNLLGPNTTVATCLLVVVNKKNTNQFKINEK